MACEQTRRAAEPAGVGAILTLYVSPRSTFPLMKKSDVNGNNTNEVFKYLKSEAKGLLGTEVSLESSFR